MFLAEVKNHWWGLEHEQLDEALLVVTNCIDFAGMLYFLAVYWLQSKGG